VIKASDEELEECERDIVIVGSETVGDQDGTRVEKSDCTEDISESSPVKAHAVVIGEDGVVLLVCMEEK
jgi:hypothetical protein